MVVPSRPRSGVNDWLVLGRGDLGDKCRSRGRHPKRTYESKSARNSYQWKRIVCIKFIKEGRIPTDNVTNITKVGYLQTL